MAKKVGRLKWNTAGSKGHKCKRLTLKVGVHRNCHDEALVHSENVKKVCTVDALQAECTEHGAEMRWKSGSMSVVDYKRCELGAKCVSERACVCTHFVN